MSNRILLIGYNFSPELTGIGKYSGEMIEWLVNMGYNCSVVTSYPYYPNWRVQEPYRNRRFWFKKEVCDFGKLHTLKVYRCPMYVPKKPSGLKRIILDMTFFLSASLQLFVLLFKRRFDSIIVIAPSFQLGLLGIFYKFLKGGKMIYHIQDMQIEAAQDLNMIKSKSIIDFLFRIEHYIFKRTDVISTISEQMVERIAEKAKRPVLLFPNWADTKFFKPLSDKERLKEKFGFASEDFIILYSGGIGEKQGLDAILIAADYFKSQSNIKFVICGTGPYKEKLKNLAQKMTLKNVHFMPLQPLQEFNDFLNIANIHLVIQKAKASDLVMPSKLTTILAVGGLALITANSDSGLYKLVQKYRMGFLVDAENQEELQKGIQHLYAHGTGERDANARIYSEQYLSLDKVMNTFTKEALT